MEQINLDVDQMIDTGEFTARVQQVRELQATYNTTTATYEHAMKVQQEASRAYFVAVDELKQYVKRVTNYPYQL